MGEGSLTVNTEAEQRSARPVISSEREVKQETASPAR